MKADKLKEDFLMGTGFWWFYDTIAVATLLVCIFLSGRKGFMKAVFSAIGCAVALLVAFAVSSGVSGDLYKNTARSNNIKKLEKDLKKETFTQKYASYLENMGYYIKVDTAKLEKAFESETELDKAICNYINNINARKVESNEAVLLEKVREGYAVVMSDIIEQTLNKFVAETAANQIREDSSNIREVILLIKNNEHQHESAVYISDNFTQKAYTTIFRLIIFVVLYLVMALIIIAVINSFTKSSDVSFESTGSHIAGGFIGIVTGAIMIFAVSAVIRLWAIMGNNEMLFFNNDVIDKTYIFKYFYDLTMKM